MIAVCSNCKTIFEDRGIVIQDSRNVTLINNFTICPKCKSRAKYLDGTFNFDSNGVISILSAPQFTVDILNQIRRIVEDVQKNNISQEEFHKKVDKLPPLVSKVLQLIIPKDPSGFWTMIGTLLMVIYQIIGQDVNKKDDSIINTETKIESRITPLDIPQNNNDTLSKSNNSSRYEKK